MTPEEDVYEQIIRDMDVEIKAARATNKYLAERVLELHLAIKEHAAQRLDDRCFLDDLKLYKLVGIDEHPGLALPEEEFLGNCKRYWKCQQTGEKYIKGRTE